MASTWNAVRIVLLTAVQAKASSGFFREDSINMPRIGKSDGGRERPLIWALFLLFSGSSSPYPDLSATSDGLTSVRY